MWQRVRSGPVVRVVAAVGGGLGGAGAFCWLLEYTATSMACCRGCAYSTPSNLDDRGSTLPDPKFAVVQGALASLFPLRGERGAQVFFVGLSEGLHPRLPNVTPLGLMVGSWESQGPGAS